MGGGLGPNTRGAYCAGVGATYDVIGVFRSGSMSAECGQEERAQTVDREEGLLCARYREQRIVPRGACGVGARVGGYMSVGPAKHAARRPFVPGRFGQGTFCNDCGGALCRQVETSQQLKLDLAILAEAFSTKEAELEAVSAKLEAAAGREAELKQQLKAAETSMVELKVGKQPC